MQLVQSIEYNMRNIFVEKPHAKCGEEIILRFFLKKSKLSISLDINSPKFWGNLKPVCRPFDFILCKAFSKNKKGSGTSVPALFSAWFSKKKICLVISINWPNFIIRLSLIREILSKMCCNSFLTRLWRHKFRY